MLSLIAAISKNNCIGKNNKLLWNIPDDMKHFVKITKNKTVLMGRKTWESIPAKFRPLPNRTNIIITRNTEYKTQVPKDVRVYTSIKEALNNHPDKEVIVIGGGQIYKQTIDMADKLYITHVNMNVDGDAFFPEINLNKWQEIEREDHEKFSFVNYKKI
jgi:dihydrofolate reductase